MDFAEILYKTQLTIQEQKKKNSTFPKLDNFVAFTLFNILWAIQCEIKM